MMGLAERLRSLRQEPPPRPSRLRRTEDEAPVEADEPNGVEAIPRQKPLPRTRRLEQVLVLAVRAEFTPHGVRLVRVMRTPDDWYYELVEPDHADSAIVQYARTVLGQLRGGTPPEAQRQVVAGRRVEAAATVAVPDPLADGGVRVVRILRGGEDWCYEVIAPDTLAEDVLAFVRAVVRDVTA